jgi:thioredoxin reductase/Pyruvate/2-oxoacid:ferredoxin oxidoreductase delta subunit
MMEQLLIWLFVAALAVAVFVSYWIRFHQSHRKTVQEKQQAAGLGLDRPRLQYPQIDAALCIGCGSCVAACPEGDVLGVVHGTAAVINGVRCVGHGYCAEVCPVGAIQVGLGDVQSRPDMPILTNNFETTVPGLFIAGELGGLSLIRNAVAQGKTAVEEIARRAHRGHGKRMLELAIVGAGPAGLSAALAAIQNKLDYILLEELEVGGTILHYPRRKLVMTQPVEIPLYGWLKETEYSKEYLLETWQKIVARFKLNVRTQEKVEGLKRTGDYFELHTARGYHCARFVLLALGRRGTPRKLGVPGEELPKVTYQLMDAQSYTRRHLLVVGGGDAGVEAAVGLARQVGNTVTLIHRKDAFARIKKKNAERITELVHKERVKALPDAGVEEIRSRSVLLKTERGQLELPNDYVFVFIGGVPPFDMLKKCGVTFGGRPQEAGREKAVNIVS